mmetsp:Transcript_27718/g.59244  ORF Transcript_27718/g.59244 Transcript_27718/m.59244 type:complete len:221 (+) Transcript_27718:1003-1665(+)
MKGVGVLGVLPLVLVLEFFRLRLGTKIRSTHLEDALVLEVVRFQPAPSMVVVFLVVPADEAFQKMLAVVRPGGGQQPRGRPSHGAIEEIGHVGSEKGLVAEVVFVEHPGDGHAVPVGSVGIDYVAAGDHQKGFSLGYVYRCVHGVRAGSVFSQSFPLDLGVEKAVFPGTDPIDEALLVGLRLPEDLGFGRDRRCCHEGKDEHCDHHCRKQGIFHRHSRLV